MNIYAKEDYKIIGECGEVDIATDNPEEFFRSATEEETNDIIKNFVNEQKPAEWSEEDALIIARILCICNDFERSFESSPSSTKVIKEDVDKIDNWLKSLRPQNKWKPSDEQISVLSRSLKYINTISQNYCHVLEELLAQLKKLREE